MDHSTYMRESAINRDAYLQLREHIQKSFRNQYVAMARGKIIGVKDTFDAARELVNTLDPRPDYFLVFPANLDPNFDLVYDLSWSAR